MREYCEYRNIFHLRFIFGNNYMFSQFGCDSFLCVALGRLVTINHQRFATLQVLAALDASIKTHI